VPVLADWRNFDLAQRVKVRGETMPINSLIAGPTALPNLDQPVALGKREKVSLRGQVQL
jgi:hypothetical protein